MSGAIQKSTQPENENTPHAILRELDPAISDAAPRRSTISRYAFVIIFMVAVGGGAIAVMRQIGLRAGINMSLASLKYDKEKALPSSAFDKIMLDLAACDSRPQIPSDYIVVDPFRSDSHATGTSPNENALAEAEQARLKALEEQRKLAEKRAQDIQAAYDRLVLLSVINGARPVANISNTPVRIGDTVGEFFTLVAIDGAEAILTCDGLDYVLVLGEEPTSPARKSRKPRRK